MELTITYSTVDSVPEREHDSVRDNGEEQDKMNERKLLLANESCDEYFGSDSESTGSDQSNNSTSDASTTDSDNDSDNGSNDDNDSASDNKSIQYDELERELQCVIDEEANQQLVEVF